MVNSFFNASEYLCFMLLFRMQRAGTLALLILISNLVSGQTTLPDFQVIQRNGWVVVSWNNVNKELTQLIIQRSKDSLTGFRSIVSMPDPTSPTNGYVDKKPGSINAYYRIFYVMPGSRYVFTDAKKPALAPLPTVNLLPAQQPVHEINSTPAKPITQEPRNPPVTSQATPPSAPKDSSAFVSTMPYQRVELKRENWKPVLQAPKIDSIPGEEIFNPSAFIFTNTDGNLIIALPDVTKKKFSLRVFRDDNIPVFEMKHIRENQLLIDRSNFHQSGWFRYELLESDRIREKNRFYIKPDGR